MNHRERSGELEYASEKRKQDAIYQSADQSSSEMHELFSLLIYVLCVSVALWSVVLRWSCVLRKIGHR